MCEPIKQIDDELSELNQSVYQKRMKYKKILVVSILSVFICFAIIYVIYKKNDFYSSSIAVSCVGKKYEVKSEGTYLTLELELNDKKIIKTRDSEKDNRV